MSQALTQILYLGTLCNNKFRKITQYRKTYPVHFSFSIKSVYDLGPAPAGLDLGEMLQSNNMA